MHSMGIEAQVDTSVNIPAFNFTLLGNVSMDGIM